MTIYLPSSKCINLLSHRGTEGFYTIKGPPFSGNIGENISCFLSASPTTLYVSITAFDGLINDLLKMQRSETYNTTQD